MLPPYHRHYCSYYLNVQEIGSSSANNEIDEAIDVALMTLLCIMQYVRIIYLVTKHVQTKVKIEMIKG